MTEEKKEIHSTDIAADSSKNNDKDEKNSDLNMCKAEQANNDINDDTTDGTATGENTVAPQIPLHSAWTIWFDNPKLAPPGSDWKDNLKKCGSFNTVDNFWRIFNNLRPASKLQVNSNYHVFRNGVQPMWEDPVNINGGKFVFTLPKKDNKSGRCDEMWMLTVMAILGETIDLDGNQVCGAVVSIRKAQDRIALWMRSSQQNTCIQIGARWKKVLGLNHKVTLKFQSHRDAAASGRSFRNEVQFQV